VTAPSEDFFEEEALLSEVAADSGHVDIGSLKRGDDMAPLVCGLLRCIGEDVKRDGLLKTPRRVDLALRYLTKGYHEKLEEVVNDAIFESSNEDIVLVKDIDIFSTCEHHMLPFYGKAHIAYLPAGKVIGISKLPRIADMFARRLQIQENLTQQIAEALDQALAPKGVAVIVECAHMCMVMRGVQKVGSTTVTRAMTGQFRTDSRLRREFFALIGKHTD
jgi:GTP cyclohydrolase IA